MPKGSKYGPLSRGTPRGDGGVFLSYKKHANGSITEQWGTPEDLAKQNASANQRSHKTYASNWLRAALRNARKRASEKGFPFDITVEDIEVPEFCPCCGVKMALNKRGVGYNSFSIDRLVPSLGYVRGNVIIICAGCNSIKAHATPPMIKRVHLFTVKQYKLRGIPLS